MITFDDFLKVDMRVGRVVAVDEFPEARKPAWKLTIDFGPEIGTKRSSAQITNYAREELEGRLVVAVVNFPPRQIGPFMSEVLTLGASDEDGNVILLEPAQRRAARLADPLGGLQQPDHLHAPLERLHGERAGLGDGDAEQRHLVVAALHPVRPEHAVGHRRDLGQRALDRGHVARVAARHVAQEARAERDVAVLVAGHQREALHERRQRAHAAR